jgi:hypothetical protein
MEFSERHPGEIVRGGVPPLRGADRLTAVLANGRTVWLRIAPTPVRTWEVNEFLRVAMGRESLRDDALRVQRAAIARLSASTATDFEHLIEARLVSERKLRRRLASAGIEIEGALSHAILKSRAELEEAGRRGLIMATRLNRRELWDKAIIVSGVLLFSVYGQTGNPFAPNNLTLAVLLLVWLIGDKVTEFLTGTPQEDRRYHLRDTDIWSYIAPFANVLAGWLLLHNQQNERFIAGIGDSVDFVARGAVDIERRRLYLYRQTIDLTDALGPDHVADFVTFANVPAVVSIVSMGASSDPAAGTDPQVRQLSAQVDRGTLIITVFIAALEPAVAPASRDPLLIPSVLSSLKVAWIVDTKEPAE